MGSTAHKTHEESTTKDMLMVTIWSLIVCGILYYLDFKYQIGKKLEINDRDISMVAIGVLFFCVLWGLLEKVFFAPYIKLVELREQATVGADDTAANKENEARKLNDQYDSKILEVRTSGVRLKEKMQNEAKKEATIILEKSQAEAEQIISSSKSEIASRAKELSASATKEAESLAGMMVNRILGVEKGMH